MYTPPSIKFQTSRQPVQRFLLLKTGLNKRKRYADCLDFRHFILGRVYFFMLCIVQGETNKVDRAKRKHCMRSVRAVAITFIVRRLSRQRTSAQLCLQAGYCLCAVRVRLAISTLLFLPVHSGSSKFCEISKFCEMLFQTYLNYVFHCTEKPLFEKGNINKRCFLSCTRDVVTVKI
jgi:hypothetical protein